MPGEERRLVERLAAEAWRSAMAGWRGPVYYDTLWREICDAVRGAHRGSRVDELVGMAQGNAETLQAALRLVRARRRRGGVVGLAETLLVEAIARARRQGS